MKTNLEGRIANLGLGPRHVPQALFEAVSNSLQAISAADRKPGKIQIRLIRSADEVQLATNGSSRGPEPLGSILKVEITDDGEGFTNANMESFDTLDSQYKASIGGKGVGRLLWLFFFDEVRVKSFFREDEQMKTREFAFSVENGVQLAVDSLSDQNEERTVVCLSGLRRDFAKSFRSKGETILGQIQNHFLSIFLIGGAPEITVIDGDDICKISNSDLPPYTQEEFQLDECLFSVIHVKIRSPEQRDHRIHYCANGRVVKSEKLKALPDSRFTDDDGADFYYQSYVSSPFLDGRANQERTEFAIDDEPSLIPDISMNSIRSRATELAHQFLVSHLSAMKACRDERINQVIDSKLPEYRYLLEEDKESLDLIDLGASEAEIRTKVLELHFTNQQSARDTLASVVSDVREKSGYDAASFNDQFEKEFERISRVNNASLVSYLIFRKSIIDLLAELLQKNDDGTFAKEAAVHELFFPMGKDVDPSRSLIRQNLWLIDERLTYASYIASDRPLAEHKYLFDTTDKGEPDVACYFNLGYSSDSLEDECLHEVVLVEFKRPGPLHARREDPYTQCMRYVDKIRDGLHNEAGQRVKASEATRFYCYIVCEIDNEIVKSMVRLHRFTPLFAGEEGFFLYNEPMKAHVEIMPFKKILRAARRNHRSFFEHAGLAG